MSMRNWALDFFFSCGFLQVWNVTLKITECYWWKHEFGCAVFSLVKLGCIRVPSALTSPLWQKYCHNFYFSLVWLMFCLFDQWFKESLKSCDRRNLRSSISCRVARSQKCQHFAEFQKGSGQYCLQSDGKTESETAGTLCAWMHSYYASWASCLFASDVVLQANIAKCKWQKLYFTTRYDYFK